MPRLARFFLWALVLTPIILIPAVLIGGRIWFHRHLQNEMKVGDTRVRMVHPHLSWDLDFHVDSLLISDQAFSLSTGGLNLNLIFWQSLASLRPSIDLETDVVSVSLSDDSAGRSTRKNDWVPTFPGPRILVPFRFHGVAVRVSTPDSQEISLVNPEIRSDGPKGIIVSASGLEFSGAPGGEKVALPAKLFVGARWFGKSLRYQIRVDRQNGDFVHLEGAHTKTDLRGGRDSLDFNCASLKDYANFFRAKKAPDFRLLRGKFSLALDSQVSMRTTFQATTPPFFLFGAEHVDLNLTVEDYLGRIIAKAQGDSGESLYLQGQYALPNFSFPLKAAANPSIADKKKKSLGAPSARGMGISEEAFSSGAWSRWLANISGTFSGYSRNLHMGLGGKILPAEVEIRKLRILPGWVAEADVRTRDSSLIHLRAIRTDSLPWPRARVVAPGALIPRGLAGGRSPWKCDFNGRIGPRESWAHAWTDTNVHFSEGRVLGQFNNTAVSVQAWVRNPKAFGAECDSGYANQTVRYVHGYYLHEAHLWSHGVRWEGAGKVEWEKHGNNSREASLEFAVKNPRFGEGRFNMPNPRQMNAKAIDLVLDKAPYPRLGRILTLHPTVAGDFRWDVPRHIGATALRTRFIYDGKALSLDGKADWDSTRMRLESADLAYGKSRVRLSGAVRLHGKHFYALWPMGRNDVQSVSFFTEQFDAAELAEFLGPKYPVERGILDGSLSFTDSAGFRGRFSMDHLELTPLKKQLGITHLNVNGKGDDIEIALRTTAAAGFPWLNDTVSVRVSGLLGGSPLLNAEAASDDGLRFAFAGNSPGFRKVEGNFTLSGRAVLPGQAGEIKDVRLTGRVSAPFANDFIQKLAVDSGAFGGRYSIPGLDTQVFSGTVSLHGGKLIIPDIQARNAGGTSLTGEAVCDFTGSPKVNVRLNGSNLSLRFPGIQKLIFRDASASLKIDTAGLSAHANISSSEFYSLRPPVTLKGNVLDLEADYFQPPQPAKAGVAPLVGEGIGSRNPRLRIKGRVKDFLFKHKIGFRDIEKILRTVKTDKRKKRVKPIDVQINLETAGTANRIETDILRMNLTGDLAVRGTYPYTLLTGEFSALSGELGQTNQSYDITDFDLKWQNATAEEGRLAVEGRKKLRADCKPDTKRTCNVYIKLAGRLDEMGFTYDTDCGSNTGEAIEPAALINSVSRGCYSDQYIAGAGGGNYGEAVVNFLEPTLNEKLSSMGNSFSQGWIKSTQVTGIGSVVSSDTAGSEPIALELESKEKWGVSVRAKAGYHPEKKLPNPWEDKVSLQWKPPLDRVATDSTWRKRVRDRVTLEASAESRPEEKVGAEQNTQVRKQVGVSYHYKFWDLW